LKLYAAALERIAALRGAPVAPGRALAIGDALRTDLAGAVAAGLDCRRLGRSGAPHGLRGMAPDAGDRRRILL